MDVTVRELRNQTARVVDAVKSGERVTLTSRGEPVADIVPHGERPRWISGEWLRRELLEHQADAALTGELREMLDQTIEER